LAIVLGDVAGKGIPAALFMAKIASELSVFLASGLDPVSVLHRLNPRFDTRNPRSTFVTMVLAVLDYTAHEFVLVNAGHMPPLLRAVDGVIKEVGQKQTGLPLGVEPTYQYTELRLAIGPGETIVFYSDGVTDAQNLAGKRYGAERLRVTLAHNIVDAASVGERIMNDIHEFVGDAQQFDDICLLCVSRHSDE
jgi:sigma-B regulation protein RsbU (phosphoserine phosphatase)